MNDAIPVIAIVVAAVLLSQLIAGRNQPNSADLLAAQRESFQLAVSTVADATAKAIASITYPEAVSNSSLYKNEQLPSVREMPVLERDMTLDYSDPTDDTIPDWPVLRDPTGLLGDDVNAPLGIPGLLVDKERY